MTKHIESLVPRVPVRDADRALAGIPGGRASAVRSTQPLVPVHEIPGLRPDERVQELRLRVQTGVYASAAVVEQVARAMHERAL